MWEGLQCIRPCLLSPHLCDMFVAAGQFQWFILRTLVGTSSG